MIEEWKFIPGYEGYYMVSNLGNFKSVEREIGYKDGLTRIYPAKILKTETTKDNYQRIVLMKNGIKQRYMCHRTVAETFIPNNDYSLVVNHIDGNKSNNCVSNLEWCTNKENTQHAWKTGLCKPHYYPKNFRKILCIETNIIFLSQSEAARFLGIKVSSIQSSITRNGSCKGFHFIKL